MVEMPMLLKVLHFIFLELAIMLEMLVEHVAGESDLSEHFLFLLEKDAATYQFRNILYNC
jgi:hypothetical protein